MKAFLRYLSLALLIASVESSASGQLSAAATSKVMQQRGGAKATKSVDQSLAVKVCTLMAANCGYLNGYCMSEMMVAGKKQPSVAVTGSWSQSATGFANDGIKASAFQHPSLMILSYFGGSCLAGLINPNPSLWNVPSKEYGVLSLLSAVMLYFAKKIGSESGGNKPFYLVALVAGIVNSCTSTLTANLCRTAHFSGITSDIGTFTGTIASRK